MKNSTLEQWNTLGEDSVNVFIKLQTADVAFCLH
jgi:hypothetical protein